MLLLAKLKFRGTLRISAGISAEETGSRGIIHSDTLFSGIINQWVRIYDDETIKSLFDGLHSTAPSFTLSSAYPYYLFSYYLPTPLGTGALYMDKLRDIPFLELFDFLDLVQGNTNKINEKDLKRGRLDFLSTLVSPRVTIDRITTATNLYQEKGLRVKEGGGLYFLMNLRDPSLKERLEFCIKLLGESGIGGDRSIGCGQFDVEIFPIDDVAGWSELFKKRSSKNIRYCALSLCCPMDGEAKEAVSYTLTLRCGWIFSNSSTKQMKKRSCRMFSEGSLFRRPLVGRLVDVTPTDFKTEHDVYRYGLGMMIEMAA